MLKWNISSFDQIKNSTFYFLLHLWILLIIPDSIDHTILAVCFAWVLSHFIKSFIPLYLFIFRKQEFLVCKRSWFVLSLKFVDADMFWWQLLLNLFMYLGKASELSIETMLISGVQSFGLWFVFTGNW